MEPPFRDPLGILYGFALDADGDCLAVLPAQYEFPLDVIAAPHTPSPDGKGSGFGQRTAQDDPENVAAPWAGPAEVF